MNSDGECVSMDSENQLCRDQKGNCRSHGSRWRYKCYKVSCQNNRVEIINASKIDHIGAQEDLVILKKKSHKTYCGYNYYLFLTECCVKDSKGDSFYK